MPLPVSAISTSTLPSALLVLMVMVQERSFTSAIASTALITVEQHLLDLHAVASDKAVLRLQKVIDANVSLLAAARQRDDMVDRSADRCVRRSDPACASGTECCG